MVAFPWHMEEDHFLDGKELLLFFLAELNYTGVVGGINLGAGKIIVPVGTGLYIHWLTGDHGNRAGSRLIIAGRSIEQFIVAKGERLIIIIHGRQGRIMENLSKGTGLAGTLQPQLLATLHPAAAVFILVLPAGRIAGSRLGFHVVPPHIFRPLTVGPLVFASDTASMATDTLVEVENR
jgi:hypothetical protein